MESGGPPTGGPPLRGYIDPNFPNPNGPQDAGIIIYGYTPSFVLAVLAAALFLLLALFHLFLLIRWRAWYFTPMVIAATMEVVGYGFRILSAKISPYNVRYFVIQYFFIVTAPVFLAASMYICLTKLVMLAGRFYKDSPLPKSAVFKPKFILFFFIVADVVATGTQVAGAALIGVAESDGKDSSSANNILLGGLAFQVTAFLIFLILLSVFISRTKDFDPRARRFSWVLLVASCLVWGRTIFRLAETAEGVFGYLSTHEAFFGALEFAPVVLAVGVLGWWYPERDMRVKSGGVGGQVAETEMARV